MLESYVNIKKWCLKFQWEIYVKNNVVGFFDTITLTARKKLLIVNALVHNIITKEDIPNNFNISDIEFNLLLNKYSEKREHLTIKDFQLNKLWLDDDPYLSETKTRINIILEKKNFKSLSKENDLVPQELKILKVLQLFKWKIVPDELLFSLIQGRSSFTPNGNILKVLTSKLRRKLPNTYCIRRIRWRWYILVED